MLGERLTKLVSFDVISIEEESVLGVRRWNGSNEVLMLFDFKDREARLRNIPCAIWNKRFDSAHPRWMGAGSRIAETIDATRGTGIVLPAHSVLLFEKEIAD